MNQVKAQNRYGRWFSWLRYPGRYLWFLPALLAFFAQRFLAGQPRWVEDIHIRFIFRGLSVPLSWLSSLLPFSLTEWSLLIGVPGLLAGLVAGLIRLIRQKEKRLARLGRFSCRLAWILSVLYLLFMLLHGFNYARLPIAESFQFPVQQRTPQELARVTGWLVEQTNQAREDRLEDENGVFRYSQPRSVMLKTAVDGYHAAADTYPLLAGINVRPKPVMLSYYWSYTGISGMYFPFFVEANVNVSAPDYQVLDTTLHEIAHLRGFAREDEANFLAFLTGIHHPDPDFTYASLLSATNRCLNALFSADREAHAELLASLSPGARRDLQASREFWRQFEGPVRETSTRVNHAYLQANLQEDGVRSYGRVVDLILAWYVFLDDAGELASFADELAGRAAPADSGY